MDPKSSDQCLFKRTEEGDLDTETQGRRPHDDGGRDWNEAVISQGFQGFQGTTKS